MGVITEPKILRAKIWHKRNAPRVNDFTYTAYYLTFPIAQWESLKNWMVRLGRFGLLSVPMRDHGAKDGSDCRDWVQGLLAQQGLQIGNENIVLLTLPRVLGYGFNPVSFWFCYAENKALQAVVAEVNNTFGETHSYLIFNDDHSPLSSDAWYRADKQFHVSPFYEVEGKYHFRFQTTGDAIGVWIDYYRHEEDSDVSLHTSIVGKLVAYSPRNLWSVFWQIPHVTFKVIALIHWQAIKLWSKKVAHYRKPPPPHASSSSWKQRPEE